jgi:hypothetical protein
MSVVVSFEFETEADAVAVVNELEADVRARATEIRLADGRMLGFDKCREELLKAQKAGSGRADN